MRDKCVFIHSNHKQMVGAKVAAYALKRNSQHAGEFDVEIIDTADHPWLQDYEGKLYLRDGARRVWLNAAFHAAGTDGLSGTCGGHRSGYLRHRRHP